MESEVVQVIYKFFEDRKLFGYTSDDVITRFPSYNKYRIIDALATLLSLGFIRIYNINAKGRSVYTWKNYMEKKQIKLKINFNGTTTNN